MSHYVGSPARLAERAALLAIGLFLYLNGYRLSATQTDTTLTVLAVVAGELGEDRFAAWLRGHIAPVRREAGA